MNQLKKLVVANSTNNLDIEELSKVRFIDIDFKFIPTKILIRNASKNKKPRYTFIRNEASYILLEHAKLNHGWHPQSLNLDLRGTEIFS